MYSLKPQLSTVLYERPKQARWRVNPGFHTQGQRVTWLSRFKKSGEFDRIRRELFAEFQGHASITPKSSSCALSYPLRKTSRHSSRALKMWLIDGWPMIIIYCICLRNLSTESWCKNWKGQSACSPCGFLDSSLERFPIVECATSEFLNDPKLSARITSSLERLLEDRGLLVKSALFTFNVVISSLMIWTKKSYMMYHQAARGNPISPCQEKERNNHRLVGITQTAYLQFLEEQHYQRQNNNRRMIKTQTVWTWTKTNIQYRE